MVNLALLLDSDSVINKIVIKSGEAYLGTLYIVLRTKRKKEKREREKEKGKVGGCYYSRGIPNVELVRKRSQLKTKVNEDLVIFVKI